MSTHRLAGNRSDVLAVLLLERTRRHLARATAALPDPHPARAHQALALVDLEATAELLRERLQ